MDALECLNTYYSRYDEDNRLRCRHGMVEFLTTMRYIHRYLVPGMRVMEIGAGKRAPGAIAEAIATGNRLALGQTAPARGLTLERVLYAGEEEAALSYFD